MLIDSSVFSTGPTGATGAKGAQGAVAGALIGCGRYELRFQSLFHSGRALTFPCDDRGEVHWDAMSERARSSFLRAQDGVGIEFATPAVQLSDLH